MVDSRGEKCQRGGRGKGLEEYTLKEICSGRRAGGQKIENLYMTILHVVTDNGNKLMIQFQGANANKSIAVVSRVVEAGNRFTFTRPTRWMRLYCEHKHIGEDFPRAGKERGSMI